MSGKVMKPASWRVTVVGGAGASGVVRGPEVQNVLSSYIGDLQTAWMNLQQGLTAAGASLEYHDALNVAEAWHRPGTR
jgi:hypothetical protein